MNKQAEELAQRLDTCAKEDTYPVLSPADCGALIEALEASEQTLEREREKSRRVMSENRQHTMRIAELGRENSQLKKELHNEGAANAHAYERIRELEEKYSEVSGWYVKMKTRMLSAEKRLATPVRLPQCHSMLLREDFQSDYRSQRAFKAGEVMAAIRAAGFKVEGDA